MPIQERSVNGFRNFFSSLFYKPYKMGCNNFKLGFGRSEKIQEIAKDTLRIEKDVSFTTPSRSLIGRFIRIITGLLEFIPIIGAIVAFVDSYFNRNTKTSDAHHLIESQHKIAPHQKAWYLNLALMRSAYDRADDKQKEVIRFLAANYLNKVAPKHLNTWGKNLEHFDPKYLTRHQGSPIEEFWYHRDILAEDFTYGNETNQKLAYGETTFFIPTDKADMRLLFPLNYTVIDNTTPKEDYASIIKNVLKMHITEDPASKLTTPLSHPLLIDATHILNANIITHGANKDFEECFEGFKNDFESVQKQAIKKLKAETPSLKPYKREIREFLNKNTACISRVESKKMSGIKRLPLGSLPKSSLNHFVVNTGTYMGAVNFRRMIYDVFLQRPDVRYDVVEKPTQNVHYYKDKEDFTKTCVFKRLLTLFGSPPIEENTLYGINPDHLRERIALIEQKPHIKVMGKATMDLLNGLIQETSQEKWAELNSNPVWSQILQTTLYSIQGHLASAEQYALGKNFSRTMQEIELVHAELATLLEIMRPFEEKDFEDIYKKELIGSSVPISLNNELRPGLGKTAVNIFAGIRVAVKQSDAPIRGCHSLGSYFEQASTLEHDFDSYIEDPSLDKIDMYHGQFHSNVNVGSTLTEYKRRDIAHDVRRLIDEGRVADRFTVAVDLTIDNFYSEDAKNLLEQFKDEIKAGQLNFVFFLSGQKFLSMGMDNYYGSPFYTVNDCSEKWQAFDALFEHPVYRTDPLSLQCKRQKSPSCLNNEISLLASFYPLVRKEFLNFLSIVRH